jgi:uncharacterized repeat protein (TIGR03803 family)
VKRIPSNNRLGLLSAILVTTLLMPGVFGQAVAQDPSAINSPPIARVRPVVNDYFGTKVTDPYRYMESLDNPEVVPANVPLLQLHTFQFRTGTTPDDRVTFDSAGNLYGTAWGGGEGNGYGFGTIFKISP